MMTNRLIGLTGPAGCGKTTAATHLVEDHGFVRMKFAQALKDMLRAMGLTERQIEGDEKDIGIPHLGVTPRYLMQTLGTEWGRKCIDGDFWVSVLEPQVREALDQGVSVVIDDVRFDNEAEMIRRLGGTVVFVTGRGGIDGSHDSEAGVSRGLFDVTVDNGGTVGDLTSVLDKLTESP